MNLSRHFLNIFSIVNENKQVEYFIKFKRGPSKEIDLSVKIVNFSLKSLGERFLNFFTRAYVTLTVDCENSTFGRPTEVKLLVKVQEIVATTGIKEELIRKKAQEKKLLEFLLGPEDSISLVENLLRQRFFEHEIFKINLKECPEAPNMSSLSLQERQNFDRQSFFWHLKNKALEMYRQLLFSNLNEIPTLALYYFPNENGGFFHFNLNSPYNLPNRSYQKFSLQIWYDPQKQDCYLIVKKDFNSIFDYEFRCHSRKIMSLDTFQNALESALTQIYTDFRPKRFFRNFL